MLSWKIFLCIQLMTVVWLVGKVSPLSFHGPEFRTLKSNAGIPSQRMSEGKNESVGVAVRSRHRVRRTLLSQKDKDEVVELHNSLRREEGASDMELLKWDDYLATMAEGWALQCQWKHGQPPYDASKLPVPGGDVGQNLFASQQLGFVNYTVAIKVEWHNKEKIRYNYDTMECSVQKCGHYTAVVWAATRYVGCAWTDCANLRESNLGRASYFVCNYSPAGNYGGVKPFKKGKACTQCESGAGWCDNGLCNRDCTRSGPGCECKAECHCGTLDFATCRCSCKPGWMGPDCSEKCENKHEYCGANPGWPKQWCSDDYKDAAQIRKSCPLMCGLCKAANGTDSGCRTKTDSSGNSLIYNGVRPYPIIHSFLVALVLVVIPPNMLNGAIMD